MLPELTLATVYTNSKINISGLNCLSLLAERQVKCPVHVFALQKKKNHIGFWDIFLLRNGIRSVIRCFPGAVSTPPPQASFWSQYPSLPEDSKNLKITSSYHMITALISFSVQQIWFCQNKVVLKSKNEDSYKHKQWILSLFSILNYFPPPVYANSLLIPSSWKWIAQLTAFIKKAAKQCWRDFKHSFNLPNPNRISFPVLAETCYSQRSCKRLLSILFFWLHSSSF